MRIRFCFVFYALLGLTFFTFPINLRSQTWQQLEKQMLESFQSGQFDKAILFGEEAIKILKQENTKGADYGSVLNNLAYVYLMTKDYVKAENCYNEVIQIITPILGKNHLVYARTLEYLSDIYLNTQRLDKAKENLQESNKIKKVKLKADDPAFAAWHALMAKLCFKTGEFDKSIQYQDTVIAIQKKTYGLDYEYFESILQKAKLLKEMNDFKTAVGVLEELTEVAIKSSEYSYYLRELAKMSYSAGMKPKAAETYEKLRKEALDKYGRTYAYAYYTDQKAIILAEMGKHDEALKLYSEALKITENEKGIESMEYAFILNDLAVLYFQIGDFQTSEKMYIKSMEIIKKAKGENHPDLINSLNGLAVIYQESGNFKKAEPLYEKAINILKEQGVENLTYFALLTNLGELYKLTERFVKAADTYLLAYKLGLKLYGRNSLEFGKLVLKIANIYKAVNVFDIAEPLYQEALLAFEASVGKNTPEYGTALNNRGGLYLKKKDFIRAEKDYLEAAKIDLKFFGEFHPQYAVVQNNLAALYYEMGQKEKCGKYLIPANENLINHINQSLGYMTEQESSAFLNYTDYLFDIYYSYYYLEKSKNPKLTGFAYDNLLARKGLMLQSEKNLRRAVLQSNDSLLIKDYLKLLEVKENLAKLYTSDTLVNPKEMDLMRKKADEIEKKLASNSTIFSSRTEINQAGWKEVQKNLQKGEIAIEFIRFRLYNLTYTDTILYCALLLNKEDKFPRMVYMFEENELSKLIKKEENFTDEMYIGYLHHKKNRGQEGYKPENDTLSNNLDKLIWGSIEPHLGGIKTIFYSASGLLNNISLAAISINDTTYVSDKYKLNTLISTRNIIGYKRYVSEIGYKVSLYGGIDYDVKPEDIYSVSSSYQSAIDKSHVNIDWQASSTTRGEKWSYLDGTLEEAQAIENLFRTKKIEVESYKGKFAIEETFKQYTGNIISPNVIHIATHGFFFPDPKSNTHSELIKSGQKNVFKQSSNPLMRSGLLFAGANRSWNHEEMPEGSDDGILTAYEVSNTNLDNTELVVLSACETGLGEIKGSEGVYGLQRSFKIAGAEYIIMSLWQIPDYQTVELMKLFYTYKSLNFTIPEAFNLAQTEMKRKYLPFYWAAFVLLK